MGTFHNQFGRDITWVYWLICIKIFEFKLGLMCFNHRNVTHCSVGRHILEWRVNFTSEVKWSFMMSALTGLPLLSSKRNLEETFPMISWIHLWKSLGLEYSNILSTWAPCSFLALRISLITMFRSFRDSWKNPSLKSLSRSFIWHNFFLFIHGLQLDLQLTFFTGKVSQYNWKSSAENLEAISSPLVRHRILAQDLELSFTLKWAIFSSVMGLYE